MLSSEHMTYQSLANSAKKRTFPALTRQDLVDLLRRPNQELERYNFENPVVRNKAQIMVACKQKLDEFPPQTFLIPGNKISLNLLAIVNS